ncbi:MAG: ChaN family lipoprotein [Deltaproteobacteria bacterium]|nr:ChaN family lipoprotein [Deltaproteobacteria bacterium]
MFHRNQILDLSSGKAVSFSEFMDHISSFDVVFVGETHTNVEHHLIQVQILQALLARVPSLSIGMEFFEQDQQDLLDQYTMGDATEEQFLESVDWKTTWGYPFHFYRPLLLAAKQDRIPVLALNAPRNIVKKVAREGLDGLEERERELIPCELDLGNEAHRAYVLETYERHDSGNLKKFQFFYEAQCVWDETMARNIAEFIKKHSKKIIVFSGNGHISWKFGIPDRTKRRLPVSVVTIMPYQLHETVILEKDMADYVWLTAQ